MNAAKEAMKKAAAAAASAASAAGGAAAAAAGAGGAGGASAGAPSSSKLGLRLGQVLVGLGVLSYGVYEGIYNVQGGHRAIVFSRISGVKNTVYREGMHFCVPWLEWPVIYDIRAKPLVISTSTGSRDLQTVQVSVRVLSRPSANDLPEIYRTLGTDYDQRVLPSIVNEILKSVIARFTAAQLLTQREQVSRAVRRRLIERAHDFSIVLEDVSITHLAFSKEYTAAIESKQDAERAKFLVEKAEQDRRSVVIRAEGEAASASMIGKAMRENPSFLALRRIEAAREIAHNLAGSSNTIYLNADTLCLNIMNPTDFERRTIIHREDERRTQAVAPAAAPLQ